MTSDCGTNEIRKGVGLLCNAITILASHKFIPTRGGWPLRAVQIIIFVNQLYSDVFDGDHG